MKRASDLSDNNNLVVSQLNPGNVSPGPSPPRETSNTKMILSDRRIQGKWAHSKQNMLQNMNHSRERRSRINIIPLTHFSGAIMIFSPTFCSIQ